MSLAKIHTKIGHIFDHHWSRDVAFRVLTRSDIFPLFMATKNAEFNKSLLWSAPEKEEELAPQVDKLIREHQLQRSVALSVVDRNDGTWKGMAIFKSYRDGVEVSLYLHPSTWGRGTVVSAGIALTRLISREIPEVPIYNRIKEGNELMQKVNRHMGYVKIDKEVLVHHHGHDVPVDVYVHQPQTTPIKGVGEY